MRGVLILDFFYRYACMILNYDLDCDRLAENKVKLIFFPYWLGYQITDIHIYSDTVTFKFTKCYHIDGDRRQIHVVRHHEYTHTRMKTTDSSYRNLKRYLTLEKNMKFKN